MRDHEKVRERRLGEAEVEADNSYDALSVPLHHTSGPDVRNYSLCSAATLVGKKMRNKAHADDHNNGLRTRIVAGAAVFWVARVGKQRIIRPSL